jgi:hypothetical protein
MTVITRVVLMAGVGVAAVFTAGPALAAVPYGPPQREIADAPDYQGYWSGYWDWYDNEYGPYYHRRSAETDRYPWARYPGNTRYPYRFRHYYRGHTPEIEDRFREPDPSYGRGMRLPAAPWR